MKLSQGVEWALHCAVMLAQAGDEVTAPRRALAGYFDLPEAYLAKHLKSLVQAGVLSATPGARGGFRLSRPADRITVLDIVEAIDGTASTFACTEIRQRGACAIPPDQCRTPCPIAQVMHTADAAWRDSLRSTTVADLTTRLPATSHHRAQTWLTVPKP